MAILTLSELFDSIKAQEANFPLPQTEETINVGTLDLTKNQNWQNQIYNFKFAVPTYQNGTYTDFILPYQRPAPGDPQFTGFYKPNLGGVINISNVLQLNLSFEIINWSPNYQVVFTVGLESQTVAQGVDEVIFKNVSQNNPELTIMVYEGSYPKEIRGLVPLKITTALAAAGAITIPVLPVALVYAPVADSQKLNKATTSTQITAGNTTTVSFTTENSTTKPIPSTFQDVMEIQKDLSTLGSELSKIPTPYTIAIGAALTIIALGLGSSSASETTSIISNNQNSLTVTTSKIIGLTATVTDGGPGMGDLIEYLFNVKVIWYFNAGEMKLGILGYEGSNQTTMKKLQETLAELQTQPVGTIDRGLNLDADSIKALLSLDPYVAGGPNLSLTPPRFIDISHSKKGIGGGGYSLAYTYTETDTNTQTSTSIVSKTQHDSAGFLAFLGLGVTDDQTLTVQITQTNIMQSLTVKSDTQSFTLNGGAAEYYSWIYYDTVFSVFAFSDVE